MLKNGDQEDTGGVLEIILDYEHSGRCTKLDGHFVFTMGCKDGFQMEIDAPGITIFSLVCVLVHLVTVVWWDQFSITYFACWPWARFHLGRPTSYFRLVSHVLGHSSWKHLYGNLSMLAVVGPANERSYGIGLLSFLTLITAFSCATIHMMFGDTNTALLGASGVVFMMIVLNSLVNFHYMRVPFSLILTTAFWLGREVVEASTTNTNTSHMAHLVGGVVGAVVGYMINEYRTMNAWMRSVNHFTGQTTHQFSWFHKKLQKFRHVD